MVALACIFFLHFVLFSFIVSGAFIRDSNYTLNKGRHLLEEKQSVVHLGQSSRNLDGPLNDKKVALLQVHFEGKVIFITK